MKSQFSYCSLAWMFCLRNANNLINKIQEISLRFIINVKTSTFEQASKEMTTHQKNLQVLMGEVFKIVDGFTPPIMDDFFLFPGNTIIFGTFN